MTDTRCPACDYTDTGDGRRCDHCVTHGIGADPS